jgi:hypothetical protein
VGPTIEDNVAAVVTHLDWLDADPERVRALTRWPGIEAALHHLPTQHAA